MPKVDVDPIPYTPPDSATGTPYTPDTSKNNYITLPGVDIKASLTIPRQTIIAKYRTPVKGRTLAYANVVSPSHSFTTENNIGILKIELIAQVYFTDSTYDYVEISATLLIHKPADFETFTVIGPFHPVVPPTGTTIAYDAVVTDQINVSIPLNSFALPVNGLANIKVHVATPL